MKRTLLLFSMALITAFAMAQSQNSTAAEQSATADNAAVNTSSSDKRNPTDAPGVKKDLSGGGIGLSIIPKGSVIQYSYTLPKGEAGIFVIYDVTGKKIGSQGLFEGNNTGVITVPFMSPGLYIYQAVSESGHILATGKFYVTR